MDSHKDKESCFARMEQDKADVRSALHVRRLNKPAYRMASQIDATNRTLFCENSNTAPLFVIRHTSSSEVRKTRPGRPVEESQASHIQPSHPPVKVFNRGFP
jgi:hypothetical protein